MIPNNLFIVADDLGLHPSLNDGIVFLLKNGNISGVSLMPNGEAFQDAIEKLKTLENPLIGVHFVLVEEKATALERLWKNHKTFFLKYIFGLVKLTDVEKELRVQMEVCKRAGVKISFINSHQHLHLLPKIMDIVVNLAKENNIDYIRTVSEPFTMKGGLFRGLESLFLSFLSAKARRKIKKAGLKTNDIFIGFLGASNLQKQDIDLANSLAEKYPEKNVELGCHPGFENPNLIEKYKQWGRYNWQNELELLKRTQNNG
ncbi:MAG TPA: ChbG/HpnK family deacetylase [Candidatus Paceibacterota bacterium]